MATRRDVLRMTAAGAGAVLLGGCGTRRQPEVRAPGDLLYATTGAGLVVVDAGTGRPTLPAAAALAGPTWSRVVACTATDAETRVSTLDPRTGHVYGAGTLRGRLVARAMLPEGRVVALTTPGAARERSTVVIAEDGVERARWELPGNLEPEAFSVDGKRLFVLDHLPPTAPDRYRVRVLDLRTGGLHPLSTRAKALVPTGAEEDMRGQGRQAVADLDRRQLYTLYTHQPDHEHTRDRLAGGARAGAPDVHAFVHTLHLEEGWAFCVDLPEPFGTGAPGAHAIARAPDGRRVYVVDAEHGAIAHIDPDALVVSGVTRFTGDGLTGDRLTGDTAAAVTGAGELVVAAGTQVLVLPDAGTEAGTAGRSVVTPGGPVRGLAVARAGRQPERLYLGQDGAVVGYDLASGRQLSRVTVPDLRTLHHVAPVD